MTDRDVLDGLREEVRLIELSHDLNKQPKATLSRRRLLLAAIAEIERLRASPWVSVEDQAAPTEGHAIVYWPPDPDDEIDEMLALVTQAELQGCNGYTHWMLGPEGPTCPRPINGASDNSVRWCVENKHCGCGVVPLPTAEEQV